MISVCMISFNLCVDFSASSVAERHPWLMLTCFQTSVASSAMFLMAMAANPLSVNLAAGTIGQTIGWTDWALAALVPGLVSLIVVPFLLYVIYPPTVKSSPDVPLLAREKLKKMGLMSKNETIMAFTLLVTVGLYIEKEDIRVSLLHPKWLLSSVLYAQFSMPGCCCSCNLSPLMCSQRPSISITSFRSGLDHTVTRIENIVFLRSECPLLISTFMASGPTWRTDPGINAHADSRSTHVALKPVPSTLLGILPLSLTFGFNLWHRSFAFNPQI